MQEASPLLDVGSLSRPDVTMTGTHEGRAEKERTQVLDDITGSLG